MIYFIVFEINVFPHKFPIAWENPVKSTKLRDPGKLVPIFSMGTLFHQIPILCYT